MALESADDLAAMFSVEELAESASYTPDGGSAATVPVIVDRGDETLDLGLGSGIRAARRTVRVRVSDIATAGRGDVIVVNGETLTANAANRDETGRVWIVECRA